MNAVREASDLRHMIGMAKASSSGFGTNLFLTDAATERLARTGSLFAREFEGAVIVLRREPCFDRLYYAAADSGRLESALAQLDLRAGGVLVSDLVGRKDEVAPWAAAFTNAGFSKASMILRMQRSPAGQARAADTDFGIEVARAEDAEEIHAALLANFDVYIDQLPPLEETREAAASGTILLVRDGERIAALLYYDRAGLSTRLRYWLVLPKYRTEGYGGRLARRYFHDCAECRRFIVWVHESNSRAIPIYRWYGYKADSIVDVVLIKRP